MRRALCRLLLLGARRAGLCPARPPRGSRKPAPARLFLVSLLALLLPATASADSASLRAQAQAANPARYAFAVGQNAEISDTTDKRSFTVWWQPSTTTPPAGVIVALHGHGSYATDEMALWQPYAQKHGYALLALQWWFGGGEASSDYYTPDEMYPLISALLTGKGVQPGTVLFTGYSRGSANSYALAARDAAASGQRHFGLVLSNAGGATANYPPNQQIAAGAFGPAPFAGVKWAMYCGEKDPDPTINGCPAMTAAKDWVTRYGASVLLFIDDPAGDHGGFMTNSANVEAALSTFAAVLATPAPVSDVLSAAEADCLFDWGEDHYPTALAPRRPGSSTSAPYYYRRYTGSNTYLGVSSADNRLYFIDAAGQLADLGLAATWSSRAGCR